MPINTSPDHQEGVFPESVRHISNGDPGNQTSFRNPCLDLEWRTDVIRAFVNLLEQTVTSNYNTYDAYRRNHDHSGAYGDQVIDLAQAYTNGNRANAYINLDAGAVFSIKKNGDETAADLFKLVEDGASPKEMVIFPGSVGLFDHVAAAASNREVNPHNLRLAGRTLKLSAGCLIDGASNGPHASVILDPALPAGGLYAAPGLSGKSPSDGETSEGVLVGDTVDPGGYHQNIVLVRQTDDTPLLAGSDPVYGLLENTGTQESPEWALVFFAAGVASPIATDVTVVLYGQEAYSLTTVPVVDPDFVKLCQTGKI